MTANAAPNYPVSHVHLVMRFKGKSNDKEDVFHAAMKKFDKDYPIDPMRRPDEKVNVCKSCGGIEWLRPSAILNPSIMKRLAQQIGLRLKIHKFDYKCSGKTEQKLLGM